MPPLPFAPTYDFDAFTTFEDPFSYSARPYADPDPTPDPMHEPSTPEPLDNKLLGFSAPVLKAPLVDDTGQFTELSMTAELYGMFFVAEDVFAGETSGRPLELTCYRRNLWQCSGQVTLSRHASHIVDEGGSRVPIRELAARISAVESIDGKATEIISIPWKSAAGEESKVAGPPPDIPLDLSVPQETDAAGRVTVPVAWKRLQFKHATANNGRRKGLQQHYVVQISLLAKTKGNEEFVPVAEVKSGPVIVRGRSPRNFDSRRDVPLVAGAEKRERRGTNASDSGRESVVQNVRAMRGFGLGNTGKPGVIEWPQPYTVPTPTIPAKRVAASPGAQRPPPVPAWSKNGPPTPAATHGAVGRPASSVPLSLSLSEDERSPGRASVETASPLISKGAVGPAANARQSPVEEADMLYEYFPLSLDDWYVLSFLDLRPRWSTSFCFFARLLPTLFYEFHGWKREVLTVFGRLPPVDAIYRPHIVHHTIVPPEVKAAQMRNKTKRYFAAD